jgi:hypothetical protein
MAYFIQYPVSNEIRINGAGNNIVEYPVTLYKNYNTADEYNQYAADNMHS